MSALQGYLAQVRHAPGVLPAVRVPLTASSWLNVTTKASAANMKLYPSIAAQYRELIAALVANHTAQGIAVILDLHFTDDDTTTSPMALRTISNSTMGAIDFWASVAQQFGGNEMVIYELYNEPHIDDVDVWLHGNAQYAGMLEMLAAVRARAPHAVAVVAGAKQYAYDSDSLVALDALLPTGGNILYNYHPYMGPPVNILQNTVADRTHCIDSCDLGSHFC